MTAETNRRDRLELARQWKKDQATIDAVIEGEVAMTVMDVLGVCPRKACGHRSEVHDVAFRPDQMVVQCRLCQGEMRACFSWRLPLSTSRR
jgi:hypothetical protein